MKTNKKSSNILVFSLLSDILYFTDKTVMFLEYPINHIKLFVRM